MTTLILVRHATTAATGKRLGGWTPKVHLDEAGIVQAESAAERLADQAVVAVYASPLERTQDTARIVARPHGLRVRTRRGLGEVDYGEWTDKPLGQLRRRKDWTVVQQTPSRMHFPGGESIRAAQARAVDTTEELAVEHRGETIVAVSHADVIKAVIAHHVGMPLDTFQRLMIAPASISVLHLPERGHPMLLRLNDTGPLPASEGRA
ncbi:MAG: MSMEG_4193 family putative phosphomutase [Nitriliruptoraceae bacterium]|nr:MSMEG_4193 family putative phosphomutase [Nitriliruptoraceae bacterium]